MRRWLLVLVAACGGGGNGNPFATDGNGGGGADGAPPAHNGGAGVSVYKGSSTSGPVVGTSGYASFDSAGYECTTSNRIGTCYLESCTSSTTITYASAGTLTITGGAQTITLTPDATNKYAPFSAMTDLVQPGQMLTLTAAGATVPAYTATLAMPAPLTITSPSKTSTPLPVSRGADFTLAWSGGTAGNVSVSASSSSTGEPFVFCEFAASAGTGSIPGPLLAMLPAGAGAIGATGWVSTTKQASDWSLYFSAFYDSVWPDNTLASISVTFQ